MTLEILFERGLQRFGEKELLVGPMASGKSTMLLAVASIFEQFKDKLNCSINVFRPVIDQRQVMSRMGVEKERKVIRVANAMEILEYSCKEDGMKYVDVLDEPQFLDSKIIEVVDTLSKKGHYVLMGGLLKNFRDEYFAFSDFKATMEDLLKTIPEQNVHMLNIAKCPICHKTAHYTQRLVNGKPAPYYDMLIKVDDDKSKEKSLDVYSYEPRCKDHFEIPGREEYKFVATLIKRKNGIHYEALRYICSTYANILPAESQKIIEMMKSEKQIEMEEMHVLKMGSLK